MGNAPLGNRIDDGARLGSRSIGIPVGRGAAREQDRRHHSPMPDRCPHHRTPHHRALCQGSHNLLALSHANAIVSRAGEGTMRRQGGFSTDRRTLVAGLGAAGLATIGGCTGRAALGTGAADRFVRTDGLRFVRGGEPYRFVGANIWYVAWLGTDAPYGDRARLGRELDRLQSLGVDQPAGPGRRPRNARSQLGQARLPRRRRHATTRRCSTGSTSRWPRWPARHDRGALSDQFLGMVGRDDDLSLLDQRRPLSST